MKFCAVAIVAAVPISIALASPPATSAATDVHFDYTSFDTGFQQPQFDVLNYPSINGNYMMTSTDNHRPQMVANNNNLAEFYNFLQQRYDAHTAKDGNLSADEIDAYVASNSARNGPKPTWLVLNEISASLWPPNEGPPSNSTYRQWLLDCVTRLHDHYGYSVVTYAPFQNPGYSDASWQALAAKSYIGIECYLSGTEVWNSGDDNASRLEWAESQYAASKASYLARGIPADRLFLGEHFGNTATTDASGNAVGYGRAGLASAADWDTVIGIRQDAIRNVGFSGFLAYNWGGNKIGITTAEMIQHEYVYRSHLVLPTQQPQWLSDTAIDFNGTTIPLSWNQPLNWTGGVPNAAGAVANFFRTNTAARTITLDGGKTAGVVTFNSPQSYTITAGTSGALTLDNGSSPASVSVTQGSHTIAADVQLQSNASFAISNGTVLAVSGAISGSGSVTKSGPGTLTLKGTNAYAGGTTVSAGTLVAANAGALGGGPLSIGTGATAQAQAGLPQALIIASIATSGTGKFDLTNNAMVVRNSSLGTIQALIKQGFNGGAWTGAGINSSTAAADAGHLTALGYASNGALGKSSFDGVTGLTAADILVKYTYYGDADLSGTVTLDDFTQFLKGYQTNGDTWLVGDFDYSGTVTLDDFTLFLDAYQHQGASLNALAEAAAAATSVDATDRQWMLAAIAAVPEPVRAGWIVLAGLAVRRGSRRPSRIAHTF